MVKPIQRFPQFILLLQVADVFHSTFFNPINPLKLRFYGGWNGIYKDSELIIVFFLSRQQVVHQFLIHSIHSVEALKVAGKSYPLSCGLICWLSFFYFEKRFGFELDLLYLQQLISSLSRHWLSTNSKDKLWIRNGRFFQLKLNTPKMKCIYSIIDYREVNLKATKYIWAAYQDKNKLFMGS